MSCKKINSKWSRTNSNVSLWMMHFFVFLSYISVFRNFFLLWCDLRWKWWRIFENYCLTWKLKSFISGSEESNRMRCFASGESLWRGQCSRHKSSAHLWGIHWHWLDARELQAHQALMKEIFVMQISRKDGWILIQMKIEKASLLFTIIRFFSIFISFFILNMTFYKCLLF